MKLEEALVRLNGQLISNSLKYRLMFAAGGLVHLCFLIVFLCMQLYVLAAVNVLSVALYVCGSFFSIRKKTGNIYYGWMIAFFAEIILHTVMCMLLIGVEPNFYLYALVVLPVSVYVLFFSCSFRRFLITMTSFILVAVAAVGSALVVVKSFDSFPLFPLSYDDISALRMINLVASALMLIVFSLMFALEVHALLDRLHETNETLRFTATHDALTGLYNRHSLKGLFEELEGSSEPFCVVLGDIDDFKKINDTYGHDGGDLVLRTIADIIMDGIGEGDTACRWGGEEILMILRGSRSDCFDRIRAVKERINSEVLEHEGRQIRVTMTFGFADCGAERCMDVLISTVDKRLYKGKADGKNVIIA